MAIDVETAVPLSTTFAANEQIRTRTLPGGLKATTVHLGDDLSIGMAHAALSLWMKDNLYQLIDAPRLVCLQSQEHLNPNQYITEVQFPVKLQAMSATAV